MPYFIGVKGGSCMNGSMITDKQECKNACAHLNIDFGAMQNGKTCYQAKNKKCRQDRNYKIGSSKTQPICKNTGIFRSNINVRHINILLVYTLKVICHLCIFLYHRN